MGHKVTMYTKLPAGTTVKLSAYASAVDGILQVPGIVKLRVPPPAIDGPPSGPLAFRVSTKRHGATGTNRNALES